jgi:hypothetical protein
LEYNNTFTNYSFESEFLQTNMHQWVFYMLNNCNKKKWQHKLIGVQLGTLHKHCHQEVTTIIVVEQEDFPFQYVML